MTLRPQLLRKERLNGLLTALKWLLSENGSMCGHLGFERRYGRWGIRQPATSMWGLQATCRYHMTLSLLVMYSTIATVGLHKLLIDRISEGEDISLQRH